MLYTEWVNDRNEVVKRVALPLAAGLSWGDCSLDTALFHPGSYTFRAYTSWMLNFGQAGIYQKHFQLIANRADEWMASLRLQQSGNGSQASASAHLVLQNALQQPLAGQQVKLHLLNGTKVLHSNTFTTDANGGLDVDFAMPAGSAKFALLVQDSLHSLRIPLLFHRPSDIDLQFMPEGGDLLAGQVQRVGFKAIGEDGKGIGVAGKVLDSHGKEVAAFHSLHLGMGDLSFTPLAGEHYVARLSLPDSVDKDYPLPAVQTSGTLLQVRPLTDSLLVKVLASADLAQSSFLLLAQAAGGQLLYSAVLQPGDSVRVSTRDFPSGILRFTLMDLKKRPLNERVGVCGSP